MKLRGELGALWENQVPKDEFHIPYKLSMEENLSFDGEFFFLKLESCPSMEFGGESSRERIIWGLEILTRINVLEGIKFIYNLGKKLGTIPKKKLQN